MYKEFHAFPKGINPKVNKMAQLEFELAYFEAAVQHISHDATTAPPDLLLLLSKSNASFPLKLCIAWIKKINSYKTWTHIIPVSWTKTSHHRVSG